MCDERDNARLARECVRLGHLIHRFVDEASREDGTMGTLQGQGRVLALLAAKPETTQRELSYVLDMRQQSLSELLAKLERKGYVTRERSKEDGRVTVVKLTEAGAAGVPDPANAMRRPDPFEALSDDERQRLGELAGKLNASLEGRLEAMGVDPLERRPPHGDPRDPNDTRRQRGPWGRRGPWDPSDPRNPHATHRA